MAGKSKGGDARKVELKKRLDKKKRELGKAKRKQKKNLKKTAKKADAELDKHKNKVKRKARKKLDKHRKKLDKKSRELARKKEEVKKSSDAALEELEKREEELKKEFYKKKRHLDSDIARRIEEKTDVLEKLSAKARKDSEKEIAGLKKEIISTQKRLYTGRQKLFNGIAFAVSLYVFLFAVTLIKEGVVGLGAPLLGSVSSFMDNGLSAFGAGWLGAYVFQSGSVLAVTANTLAGVGAFSLHVLFFALAGSLLGNVSTPVFVAMLSGGKSRHGLRHGFELVVANSVFAFFLMALVVVVEVITGFFSGVAGWVESRAAGGIAAAFPDLLDMIIGPLKGVVVDAVASLTFLEGFSALVVFVIGALLFVASLKFLPRAVMRFLGGRAKARSMINSYFSSRWRAFLIGMLITLMIASLNMTLSLLVPLAVIGVIDLKKAIPYIMGINVGTIIDVSVAGFASGLAGAFAGAVMFIMICSSGVLFMFHPVFRDLIYRITRSFTAFMRVNNRSVILFLVAYALVPLVLILTGL